MGFVIRKMGELGYNRNAKKCKEKFENIYKYHKRTKDGRSGRPNGKAYRFFEQLEALDQHSFDPHPLSPSQGNIQTSLAEATITSTSNVIHNAIPCSIHYPDMNLVDNSTTSTSGDESEDGHKKKRKLADFFGRLMKQVVDKQENLQRKFIETLEKCERDRMAREEAWKMQELERLRRERELLVQERSIAAAKDAAVLEFLKKFSEQGGPIQLPEKSMLAERGTMDKQETSNGGSPVQVCLDKQETCNGREYVQMSSSRWPRDEVDALIRLRTNLDLQYEEHVPKGPLWEEISTAMKKLGYNRSAKRCKEKWENINKYFKRVKESNKKRPNDSKTCPYFQQLDALYKQKTNKVDNSGNSDCDERPEELLMHMIGMQEEHQQPETTMEVGESENFNQHQQENSENGDGDGFQTLADDSTQLAADNPSQNNNR